MTASTARVAFLTNFVAPYRAPLLRALGDRVGALRTVVSTPMEANRDWAAEWEGLDVVVQRSLTVTRRWRHPSGFSERVPLHVPLDTRARLDAFAPDLVIAGELGARTLGARSWCRRTGRPLVVWATLSERTEAGRDRLRRRLRRFLLSGADGVVVNGDSGARYIRSYDYPEERIHRVWQASPVAPGADGAKVGDGDTARPLALLYVGRLVELKGLEPFVRDLRSWCESRTRRVELTLVGSGPLAERLRGLETGEQLALRADGPVAFGELERVYRSADLLVLPTLADEWGLVVNEAMACGLPVLGSVHSQAVTELVEEGRTGWRYDPERPAGLMAALDRVAAAGRPGLRAMGRAARQRVAGLTPESMADRLLQVIEDVLAVHRRRP